MRAVTRTLLALAVAGRMSAPATVAAQPSDECHQSKVGSPAPEIFTARAVQAAGAQAPPGKDSVANGIAIGAAIGAGTGFALMGWAYAQCEGSCDAPEPLPIDNPELWIKFLFNQRQGDRRANIHVRIDGNPNQRYPLLFRDYLRAHPEAAAAYGALKRKLMFEANGDWKLYTGGKADFVAEIVRLATVPAKTTG